ncbi:MAG: response regulator transcription factor [Anaerolineae bacterium]|nr:response regulator transcription factor [Anaerolineae bacterium]
MSKIIRVFVGATYPVFCDGVRATLSNSHLITFLGSASSSADLLKLCQCEQPDVLLLDFHLLKSASETTLQAFKQTSPAMKILVLLADHDGISLPYLRQQGLGGVLLKSDPAEKWVEAIMSVAQNQWWMSMRLAQAMLDTILAKPGHNLSEQQLAILRLIAAGKTDKEIACHLGISPRTVQYHLVSIRASLSVNTHAELAAQSVRLSLLDL